jgi:hypothetical protein
MVAFAAKTPSHIDCRSRQIKPVHVAKALTENGFGVLSRSRCIFVNERHRMNILLRATVFTGILATISACSGGSSSVEATARNSGFFVGRVAEGTMQGVYNPEGFSAAQVRKLVAETCEQGLLTGFDTQDRTDGLRSFGASCDAWKHNAKAVEYERNGGADVVIEILGSASGSVTFNRIDTKV